MALRLGEHPRLLLTTTPRPLRWLKALSTAPGVVTTRGRMLENRENLAPAFVEAMNRDFAGTRHGRQELDGEFVEDHEGALWTRGSIEACRHVGPRPGLVRIVVAVDPSVGASESSDACGIVVAGLTEAGTALVLADRTIQGVLPGDWARVVVDAYHEFGATLVVAEVNNGGKLVQSVLSTADPDMPVKPIHAAQGKVARAEPVAHLYARDRVFHAAPFPELEDEMCAMGVAGRFAGGGRSPDRVDALVYALTELLLGKRHAEPGVRSL